MSDNYNFNNYQPQSGANPPLPDLNNPQSFVEPSAFPDQTQSFAQSVPVQDVTYTAQNGTLPPPDFNLPIDNQGGTTTSTFIQETTPRKFYLKKLLPFILIGIV